MTVNASPQKLRVRFGLRSLLILMTLIAIPIALIAEPIFATAHQRRLLAELEKMDAEISVGGGARRDPSWGQTILKQFGKPPFRDYLFSVKYNGGRIEDGDLELLRKVPYLYHLDLSNTNVTDADLKLIARCSNLYELDLRNTQITDTGIGHLKSLQQLAWLRTGGTAVTHDALSELDDHLPWLDSAEQRAIYELCRNYDLSTSGTRRMLKTEDCPGPEYSGLYSPRGGEELHNGTATFLASLLGKVKTGPAAVSLLTYLKSLESLSFVETKFEPDSFSDLPAIDKLTKLEFVSTDITDADLKDLARQTQLEEFILKYVFAVTDKGVAELAKLRNLKSLVIRGCPKVTTKAIETLQEQLPDCKITYLAQPTIEQEVTDLHEARSTIR